MYLELTSRSSLEPVEVRVMTSDCPTEVNNCLRKLERVKRDHIIMSIHVVMKKSVN